jgi:hypothetical protein
MLGKALAAAEAASDPAAHSIDHAERAQLIAELRRRLATEAAGRERIKRRLDAVLLESESDRKRLRAIEQRQRDLEAELEVAELSISQQLRAEEDENTGPSASLRGLTLLYVGGRANLIPQLRLLAERCGATLLHHDGGIDDRSGLLAAHVARADCVFLLIA